MDTLLRPRAVQFPTVAKRAGAANGAAALRGTADTKKRRCRGGAIIPQTEGN